VKPSEAEERDAALIDRLYGDVPGAEDADLGELRTVRALVARVREEAPVAEPSPAIAAALLQAARERAPEKRGVWARLRTWLMPIAAHPALAAAATVVVVAGAAALWMRDGGEVAEPQLDRAAVETKAPKEPKEEDKNVATADTPATALAPAPAPQLAEPVAPAEEEQAVAVPEKPRPRVRETAPPPAKEAPPERDEKPAVVVTGQVDGVVGGLAGGDDGDRQETRNEQKKAETTTTPPPPPPEPTTEPQGGASYEQVLSDEGGSASSADQARAVTRRARAEAEKNNCKNTSAFATEVRNLDRGVYDKEFVRDRAIDACLRRDRKKSTSGE
jgi:hypothetical protein